MLGEHRENSSGNDCKKQNMYTNDMLLMVMWIFKFLRVGYKIRITGPRLIQIHLVQNSTSGRF